MARDRQQVPAGAAVEEDPQPEKPVVDPRLAVNDYSEWDVHKWAMKSHELVKALRAEFTPIETCVMLEDWLAQDKVLTCDEMLERLFRMHHSYDGTLRKAYRILAGGDERVAMMCVKRIYSKLEAETAGIQPVMGVVRVM